MQLPDSTLDGVSSTGVSSGAMWLRRGFLIALTGLVVAALSGVLGVSTHSVGAREDGWSLSVEHAGTARAGLDVPWEVTVTHVGGFEKTLELAVTGDYFDIYETQGFSPEPSEMTRDGETLYLTFEAPEGEVFVVGYDAYIQPSSQQGADATVSVLDTASVPVVSVDIATTLFP